MSKYISELRFPSEHRGNVNSVCGLPLSDSIMLSPSLSLISSISSTQDDLVPDQSYMRSNITDLVPVNGFNTNDGNLLVKTEFTIHRVHWSLFSQHSTYFQELFYARLATQTTTHIVPLDGVKSKDFRCLLSIIYPLSFNSRSLQAKDDWVSVMHLAHELSFTTIRDLAIRRLFPLTSSVEKIIFGHCYEIPDWLLEAYVAICKREEYLSVEEGECLGAHDVIVITRARYEIESLMMSEMEMKYTVWRICCPTLDVPELESLHAIKLSEARKAASDSLLSARLVTHKRRKEAKKKSQVADQAWELVQEAETNESQVQQNLITKKQKAEAAKMNKTCEGKVAKCYIINEQKKRQQSCAGTGWDPEFFLEAQYKNGGQASGMTNDNILLEEELYIHSDSSERDALSLQTPELPVSELLPKPMSRLSAARAAARRANEALRATRVQPSSRVIERSQNCCSLSSADPLGPTELPQDIPEPNTSQSLMAEGEQKSADECEDAIPHTLTFTIASYTRGINLDPTNALFYLGRADVYSMKKNHAMAIVDAEKAIELNPRLLRAYSRLGLAHSLLGNHGAATMAYRRGLELEPGSTVLRAGLMGAEARRAIKPNSIFSGGIPENLATSQNAIDQVEDLP